MTAYFITGAEGVGKSSKVEGLKKNFPDMDIHDFDEVGVPDNPPLEWRLHATKHWVKVAEKNNGKNISTIVVGLSIPSEIKKYASKSLDVRYCLLSISLAERRKRLMKRDTPEMISDLGVYNQLKNEFKRLGKEGKVIDTSNLSNTESLCNIVGWIKGQG